MQSWTPPEEALQYLGHYGYFSPKSTTNFSLFDSFSESLRNFQNFFGLSPSGLLDSDTQEMMRKPRQGLHNFQHKISAKQVAMNKERSGFFYLNNFFDILKICYNCVWKCHYRLVFRLGHNGNLPWYQFEANEGK